MASLPVSTRLGPFTALLPGFTQQPRKRQGSPLGRYNPGSFARLDHGLEMGPQGWGLPSTCSVPHGLRNVGSGAAAATAQPGMPGFQRGLCLWCTEPPTHHGQRKERPHPLACQRGRGHPAPMDLQATSRLPHTAHHGGGGYPGAVRALSSACMHALPHTHTHHQGRAFRRARRTEGRQEGEALAASVPRPAPSSNHFQMQGRSRAGNGFTEGRGTPEGEGKPAPRPSSLQERHPSPKPGGPPGKPSQS